MRIFWLLFIILMAASCSDKKTASMLNTDILERQVYTVNNEKDTVLKTAKGAIIKIERGSFANAKGNVELEVKEAYSMEDIVRAGLTTQSDGQPLKSGGMIFVDAIDESVAVVKPIGVSIPAQTFDADMKIFKGEEGEGSINWTEPKPLLDTVPQMVKNGEAIFNAQCATCHDLDKNLTGPALRGVENRGPWYDREMLFAFTRNPGGFIPVSTYAQCLTEQYNGQIMPSFPQLSDEVLTAVYDYIKYGDNSPVNNDPCRDSCRRYDSAMLAMNKVSSQREILIFENGDMTEVDYDFNPGPDTQSIASSDPVEEHKDGVIFEDNNAEYYKFSIDAFGWYNVDALLKEDESLKQSNLTVLLEGEQKEHVDIYLVVPSMKVFTRAGRTDQPDEFAFDTKDGALPLPQGVGAYILAMSENADGVMFAHQQFITSLAQQIRVQVKPSSKDEVTAFFNSSGFSEIKVDVQESKNANEIRALDKNLKAAKTNIDRLKPKNCDCFCGDSHQIPVSVDSTRPVNPINVNPKP